MVTIVINTTNTPNVLANPNTFLMPFLSPIIANVHKTKMLIECFRQMVINKSAVVSLHIIGYFLWHFCG